MTLPEEFIKETRTVMGEELFQRFCAALDEEAPVSIRLNPFRCSLGDISMATKAGNVPWCEMGCYLTERPNFTFDPLLHAGVYYVQEASSMFVYHALKQYVHEPVQMLDLCAAPGGKTTCAMSALPDGSVLYANEPIRNRAQILSENIQKFGHPDIIVTNNYPKDYRKSGIMFDVILCDVPCSGEGMFRKDGNAVSEWSLQHVAQCQQLQRSIVAEAWQVLKPGGLLIYSTCTFNLHENEENVEWICKEMDAEMLPVHTEEDWNITGSLKQDFQQPVYRFIPGKTKGEGLFMAVMRKRDNEKKGIRERGNKRTRERENKRIRERGNDSCRPFTPKHPTNPSLHIVRPTFLEDLAASGVYVDVDYAQAINYLRREAITLPTDTPRGIVTICYQGHPLGLAKNIGNRANNLYPKEWRIKSTHIPEEKNIIISLKTL